MKVPQPALRPIARGATPTDMSLAEQADAEARLEALQQRLAAAPRKEADPVRRAYAHATRKAAATADFVATPERAEVPVAPIADVVPGASDIAYANDHDPREDDPWFQQLPAKEQQRLRANWHRQRHRFEGLRASYWRDVARATWQGAAVFAVLAVLQAPMLGSLHALPGLVVAGAIAGTAGRMLGGGRFAFAFAGFAAFLLAMGPGLTAGLFSPLGLASVLIATYGMGLLGVDREMRRTGGFGIDR